MKVAVWKIESLIALIQMGQQKNRTFGGGSGVAGSSSFNTVE